jgi:hypothetical protein
MSSVEIVAAINVAKRGLMAAVGEGRFSMGDKGGKKDKAKDQKQKMNKQQQEAKRKLDKQPAKKS